MDMPEPSSCRYFRLAIDLLGKPWTGQILWVLQEGPLRFNELAARVPGIGEKVLSARLKELECQGLLVRRVLPTTPVRVEYELTCKGQGFRQVVEAVTQWGTQIVDAEDQAR
ncbi:winged helix-turn-helix transcriptional regulator [Geothrix alkalitolerans]|uniref:winged helix-turn-helix transcriptional regulator n=1 Tax=Geothrix alkalitolerans TaxID=2922724 RepID=UPI001FB04817|nr:helix-turn-helix domain-containing protein [Geothrix alkalitolerans]